MPLGASWHRKRDRLSSAVGTPLQWSRAYLVQATEDFRAACAVHAQPSVYAMLLQMTFEKIAKAAYCKQQRRLPQFTHRIASDVWLIFDRDLVPGFPKRSIDGVVTLILALERANPSMANARWLGPGHHHDPQLEYPWDDIATGEALPADCRLPAVSQRCPAIILAQPGRDSWPTRARRETLLQENGEVPGAGEVRALRASGGEGAWRGAGHSTAAIHAGVTLAVLSTPRPSPPPDRGRQPSPRERTRDGRVTGGARRRGSQRTLCAVHVGNRAHRPAWPRADPLQVARRPRRGGSISPSRAARLLVVALRVETRAGRIIQREMAMARGNSCRTPPEGTGLLRCCTTGHP